MIMLIVNINNFHLCSVSIHRSYKMHLSSLLNLFLIVYEKHVFPSVLLRSCYF